MTSIRGCNMNGEKRDDLLELIRAGVGCEYLSDLRQEELAAEIRVVTARLRAEEFSVREWSEVISYITKQEAQFDTAQQAWAFLCSQW